jgi:hypothetical protein
MYKIENEKMYISDKTGTKFTELCVGLKVYDVNFEEEGVVEECDDWHNVIVKSINDFFNLYCLIDDCEEGFFDDSLITLD